MPLTSAFSGKTNFLFIVLGFQLFRLCLLPFMGLMPQDAYYFFYGENLALSYLDHPGMIGYVLRLFTEIFGQYAFVIKLADFTITSFTLWFFWILAGYFLPEKKQMRAMVLLCITCMVSILSAISTPDVPLLLFWTLSLIFLYQAIFLGRQISWVCAGLFMGLAFDSKYTSLLLQAGLVLFLILSARYRKLLHSGWFWLSMVLSVLVMFPVIYWNAQHEYVSLLFQSSRRSSSMSTSVNIISFLGTIGHQAFILLPFLLITLVWIIYRYAKKLFTRFKLPNAHMLFLLCFFVPAFAGFFLVSFIYWVKLNWMMPAYITGIILAAIFMREKFVRMGLALSVFIHLLLAVEIVFYVVPVKSDDTWFGWRELAQQVKSRQKQFPKTFVFSDDNYKTTAQLNFYMDATVFGRNIIGENALQYDYVDQGIKKLNGRDALFIDSDPRLKNLDKKGSYPSLLDRYFAKVNELEPIFIRKGKRIVRKFWVYHCSGYRGVCKN